MSSNKLLSEWYFHHNPIEYYDPNEPTKNQYFDVSMCKIFSYAYQMEYRFLWDPLNKGNAKDHIIVDIGPLTDICELYVL